MSFNLTLVWIECYNWQNNTHKGVFLMNFELKKEVIPSLQDLLDLYNSVGWSNYTNKPDMLMNAYKNSLYVITAWNKEQLLGVIRVVGDGYSIVYIQDILVLEDYQHMGIGSRLIDEVLNKYKNVYQKVLLTENQPKTTSFYEKVGFQSCDKYGCISFIKYEL